MDNLTPQTFLIPNKLCFQTGITTTWRPLNSLSVYTHSKKSTTDTPSSHAGTPTNVYKIRQECILFEPILRKLVNESNGTFLAVQQISNIPDTIQRRNELLNHSRQYRSIVRACLEHLNEEMSRAYAPERDLLHNYVTIFYSVESVWHLVETFFIDTLTDSHVLPHLLDWIRFHFPKHEKLAVQFLTDQTEHPETHPDYWETVIGTFLQGRIRMCRALLQQHSESDTPIFKQTEQCLKTMPQYVINSGVSGNEFKSQLNKWIVDVQTKIDTKLFIGNYNLNLMMRIAVGDEVAWGEVQQYCETWYELLAAWLYFNDPMVKSYELAQHAKRAIARMSIRNRMKHLDHILLAAMEFDVLQVINEIQCMNENLWFITHLTDLLYHSNCLELDAQKLRESFLIDYGTLLMGHKSLWQVGLNYLDNCPNEGLNIIRLLLPRIGLDSELKVQKIVREALNRNLIDIAQSVCKIEAMKCMKRDRLGNALVWALKSQDTAFVSYLAEIYLKNYAKNGHLNNLDLFDNLGACTLASDRLIFLGKYYEYHKYYQEKDWKTAGNILISLLNSKITPNYFWGILFIDTVPLLESDDQIFSSNDTFIILQCLEERESSLDENQVNITRLALARNLSRSLMYEAQLNIQ